MKNIKNQINKNRFELTVIFLILLFIVLMKIVVMTAAPVSAEVDSSYVPSMFYNDSAYMFDHIWPLYETGGVYYVPVEFFKLFSEMKIDSEDRFTENFYIQYQRYDWIAFKVSAERAESRTTKNIPCKVYLLNGTAYVPAELTAFHLGLTYEVRPEYNTVRISTYTARKTFDQLLESYIVKPKTTVTVPIETTPPPTQPPTTVKPPVTTAPTAEINTQPTIDIAPTSDKNTPEPTTTKEPDNTVITRPPPPTEPPTTVEPTTAENTREIQNYLLFYDSSPPITDKTGKIDEALKILDKNNIKAVFFLSGGEITENPEILRKIYASGHELGIKFESGKINADAEDLIVELEAANGLIYSALKHRTRFCMSGENLAVTEFYENKLSQNGYYLCENTVDSDVLDFENIDDTESMVEFLKQKRYNIFVFDLNGGYENYLEMSANAAENKFYINFSYINNANIKNIKDALKRQTR